MILSASLFGRQDRIGRYARPSLPAPFVPAEAGRGPSALIARHTSQMEMRRKFQADGTLS